MDANLRLGTVGLDVVRRPHVGSLLPEASLVWLGPRHVLGEAGLTAAGRLRAVGGVASWGIGRPFSDTAERVAGRLRKPYVALEDGFLRSVAPGVLGEAGVSMVADPLGIYYDATRPSLLEHLVADPTSADDDLLHHASAAMTALRRSRVSKYNHAPDTTPEGLNDDVALVVDQRFGDVSVQRSGAGPDAFEAMFRLAVDEHGANRVVVKTHPDAVVGGRRSYLSAAAHDRGVRVVADNVNPWALLERARSVYTVSSLLGFEALVAGRRVTCFGLPFYAGWGLTRDRLACPRRRHGIPLEQVFAAAYIRYARYVDRRTGMPTSIETTIRQLADGRDQSAGA